MRFVILFLLALYTFLSFVSYKFIKEKDFVLSFKPLYTQEGIILKDFLFSIKDLGKRNVKVKLEEIRIKGRTLFVKNGLVEVESGIETEKKKPLPLKSYLFYPYP